MPVDLMPGGTVHVPQTGAERGGMGQASDRFGGGAEVEVGSCVEDGKKECL